MTGTDILGVLRAVKKWGRGRGILLCGEFFVIL